jgi:cold shock CspA family protein
MSGSYQRFLLLSRVNDETNANTTFRKRDGKTSYGFVIPENLAPDVLANIDTITRQVKQKLLADQQGSTI